uniref:CD276 antigen n=4 Tax=Cercopithecinae TaxID=9528 RepID=A0A2K5U2B3_MACFA
MLHRRGSPGMGVHVGAALGALWFCLTGALEVQVPEDPVVALVGTDATLRCSFSPEPGFSLAQLNLIWQLTDTKQLVHSFTEGRDQGSAYANRTALFLDLLAQGNASLRLQRVRVADEGSFTCFVSIRDFGSAAVSLQVAAPYSKPSMTLEPNKDLRPGDTVTITCSSYRGYPEAEVFWQDGQGAPLTGNVTTSQMANEQGLFDVHSVLRVVLGANGTYSCLVRNPVLQQDAHGSITITPQRSPTGAVEVQVPEDPVVALVGTDATLRCSFSPEPGFSLAQLNLIWQLTDTKQLVHSFTEGRDQGSAYANRTALFLDLLAQGNASLRLQRVRVADEGSFTCFVSIRDFGSAAVSLQVAAPYSKPSMTLEPNKDLRPGDTVTITCSSYRGYPEAEVFWQDGQGAPLTGNVTTSQMANEQGLFDVHSVLRVVLGANGTYSCLVRNPVLQQDAHGSITITPQRSPTGAVEVQVPEDPVVALVGTDATLRCSFSPEPGFSLAQLNLIWQLTDTKQLVHSFTEGRDQGSAYANRTALFLDLLAQGNASLRLQRVRVADEGSFTCFVSIRDFGSAAVSLQVAAPYSKPSMTLEPNKDLRPGDTVTITCSSYRGYPEAEVFWQDGQGAPLTGNVTTSQMANEQGLFDVHSVLRVVLGANGTYSCLVRNPVLQQDAHGSVTITGQPMTFPPEALWVTVGLSVCLVALLVALAFVCWRKIKQSCEEENAGAEDQDGEGEGSKTALQPLKHSDSKEDDGQELA